MGVQYGKHPIRGEAHARAIARGDDPVVVIVVVYARMRSVGMHQRRNIKGCNPVLTGESNKLSAAGDRRCNGSWRLGSDGEPPWVDSRTGGLTGIATRPFWMVERPISWSYA